MNRSCGCCGSCIEDEMQREHLETTCDFVTHVLCHTCPSTPPLPRRT
ncbi:unnamed protein product [Arabidopsis halleri]